MFYGVFEKEGGETQLLGGIARPPWSKRGPALRRVSLDFSATSRRGAHSEGEHEAVRTPERAPFSQGLATRPFKECRLSEESVQHFFPLLLNCSLCTPLGNATNQLMWTMTKHDQTHIPHASRDQVSFFRAQVDPTEHRRC